MTRPVLLSCPLCEGTGQVLARRVVQHPSRDVVARTGTPITCPCCLAQPLRLVETAA